MKLKPFLLIGIVILMIIFAAPIVTMQISKSCPKINQDGKTVIMKEGVFEPETLTIQKCTQVIFKNQDKNAHWPASNLHPTHGIYPEFDPKQPIEAGKEWSFVFDKVGKWKYHDHLSPSTRGVIEVKE